MDQTPAILPELQSLRNSIDNIDAAIVHMLAERFRCTQRVGVLKAENDLPPADPAREKRQVARLREALERKHGRRVNAQVEVDPGLIGGARIVVGDKVIDATVRGRLDAMAVALTH